jgi:cytochrome d ubiquinol oxidase subunit II
VIAGAIALGGLEVVREDAGDLFEGLTEGAGLAALLASVTAGVTTLAFVLRSKFEPARYTAAVAVAAVVAGWGFAQSPTFLPGLTVEQAAAENSTLVTLLVGLGIGAFILVPSLFVLFRLVLTGRFDPGARASAIPSGETKAAMDSGQLALSLPLALGGGAAVVLIVAAVFWLQVAAALAMLGAIALVVPSLLTRSQPDDDADRRIADSSE